MLKKILGKAVAGTAAAGLVLVPSAVTVAPQFVNVACQYPDPAATSTSVVLDAVAAPFGTRNRVTVNVSSAGATPRGKVIIRVESLGRFVKTVRGGSATLALPRTLDARNTYTISAKFDGTCRFRNSRDTAQYTVFKAGVNVNPTVQNARKARFAAAFRGAGGLDPQGGQARFVVKRPNGKTVRVANDGVRRGRAAVDMRNLKPGRYRLVVSFRGTPNFRASSDSVSFGVRRR
jgi:hypothetical protein